MSKGRHKTKAGQQVSDEEKAVWLEQLLARLRHELAHAEPEFQVLMSTYLTLFVATEANGWVDLMVWNAGERQLLSPTLQMLASGVARARLLGGDSEKSLAQFFKDQVRDMEWAFMSIFTGSGMGREEATQLTARATFHLLGWARSPSTTEREFPTERDCSPAMQAMIQAFSDTLIQDSYQIDSFIAWARNLPERAQGNRR